MNDFDSILLSERYLLVELFNSRYNIDEIKDDAGVVFSDISSLLKHMYDRKRFDNLTAYFKNTKDDTIIISFIINGNNISLIPNKYFSYKVLFNNQSAGQAMYKTNTHDATTVIGTVFKFLCDFLVSFRQLVDSTSMDWEEREKNGLILFNALSNMSMNTVSKQIRFQKEKDRGISQRGNLYTLAFRNIIKPVFPELNLVDKGGNDFEIKS
jgi:hypothetical protein